MRLALAVFAYLFGVGAVIAASVAAYQVMLPAERGTTTATASSVPPPRAEPKRVEPIRPVNELFQTPTPKYENAGVPITSTAAYNKKKAKEKYERRSSAHRNSTPRISNEAANSFGWAGQNTAPPPQRPRDWTIY